MDRLLAAIDRLIAFFDRVAIDGNRPPSWSVSLRDIRERLVSASSNTEAVRDLEACFGGMGSLNDYVFDPMNNNVAPGANPQLLNRELGTLLDHCYMELRLLNRSPVARLYWHWLGLWRFRRPAPRVMNAFR